MLPVSANRAILFLCFIVLAQAIALPLIFGGTQPAIWITLYFVIGTLILAFAILGSDAPAGSLGQTEFDLIREALKRQVPNAYIRRLLEFGQYIMLGAIWPAGILRGVFHYLRKPELMLRELRQGRRLRLAAMEGLYPGAAFLSVGLALIPLGMHGIISLLGDEPWYFDLIATIVILAIGLKHVLHLIGPAPMQAILRRAKAPVAINYVTVVICDLIALILSYNILLSDLVGGSLDSAGIKAIYAQLKAYSDVFNIVLDEPAARMDYMLGISGLLWLITLSKDLLNLKGYRRTTSDRCARAFGLAICGFDEEAKDELEKLSPHTDQDVKILAEAQAMVGNFRESLGLSKRYGRRLAEFGNDQDVEDMAKLYLLAAEKLYHSNEPDRLTDMVKFLDKEGLNAMQVILSALTTDPNDFDEALDTLTEPDDFVLAKAYVLWQVGKRQEGLEAYQKLAGFYAAKVEAGEANEDDPLDGPAAVATAVSLLMQEVLFSSDQDLTNAVEEWLTHYREQVANAATSDDRFAARFNLASILMMAAKRLSGRIENTSSIVELVDKILDQYVGSPLTDPFFEDLKNYRSGLAVSSAA
ncbi:MAG: hypothetical protein AAF871_10470 [Pseudomonadota bacterium]